MPDIGATLQEARMRARIDISEVEAATKIRAKYLRAIENEEWDMLPGPTFVKSFLRTYAEYLGLDARLLVEAYKLRYEPPPSDTELQALGPPVSPRRSRAPRPPRLSPGWVVGLSVLGLIAVLIVLASIGGSDNNNTPVATAPSTTPKARPKPRPRPVPTVARLTLVPTAEVYVCLRNSNDKLIVNSTLTPDTGSQSYRGKRFRLTVGNAAITMRVNGKALKVQPSATATTFEITPRGRRLLPETQNAC
jgi:cytoskeleton protein RodZ